LAMAGTSKAHVIITGNLSAQLIRACWKSFSWG
jgi:hypothetical protein